MEKLVETKIRAFLMNELDLKPTECGAVLYNVRKLGRAAGFRLDLAFGEAGLASGPEARVASMLVNRAMMRRGDGTGLRTVKDTVADWIRTTPPMGSL